MFSWLPRGMGGARGGEASKRRLAPQTTLPPHREPTRPPPRQPHMPLAARAQEACAAVTATAFPAAEAVVLLLQEVLRQRQRASVAVTVLCLWMVLLLSEARVLSQWDVLIAAYILTFLSPRAYAHSGEIVEELCAGVVAASAQLPQHRLQSGVAVAAAVAMYCGVGGAVAFVLRITVAAVVGVAVALWQLQRAVQTQVA
jgi:hypothetical protein